MRWLSSARSSPGTPPPPGGGEYSAVSLGSAWGIASLLLFVGALSTRQLLGLLPLRLQGHYMLPPLAVRLTPALAVVGVLFGLIGMRRESRRTVVLLGLSLNAIVVVLSLLFMMVLWWVWLR